MSVVEEDNSIVDLEDLDEYFSQNGLPCVITPTQIKQSTESNFVPDLKWWQELQDAGLIVISDKT